ncbi:hypothetical protein D9Q98_005478 [Chlorella vulgaris]|uniref:Beta-carotene isomerase D27-like C-terminal domain-containing protein n=1 Tax=Chlorella vulgaris TaxID=3077 RepID=A0A9D4YVZ5_CHLVU|nr:hypothetical protein D9Q98_005478 [Chlorella vulgaris]
MQSCCKFVAPQRPTPIITPAHRKPRAPHQRRHVVTTAELRGGGTNTPSPPPADSTITYHDSLTDIAFIGLCRLAYGRIAGWQSERSWTNGPETFRGMVEVSRSLMKGRSAAQQRDAVAAGFPQVPPWFRRVFPYSRKGAEINARITPAFFTWLVGPMQTAAVEIDGQQQMSAVKIERCRYLAESNCVGMCVNLCKSPTQHFFTTQLGMPLTMNPNFEDLSCEMVFGNEPPPLEADPVATQPCLATCATAMAAGSQRCHKLD